MQENLKIVYQDDSIIIVNKPAGMLTHQANGLDLPDVFHELIEMGVSIKTSGDSYRQGIVSRLDVGTSGLIAIAKTEESFEILRQMYHDRLIDKTYLALVIGKMNVKKGSIDAPIGKHPNRKKRALFAVVEDGKPALTYFDVIDQFEKANQTYSLLRVGLKTGRSHQIRVHLSTYGHPIVGDFLYGARENFDLNHPFLHSYKLKLQHPITDETLEFVAKLPEELSAILSMNNISCPV